MSIYSVFCALLLPSNKNRCVLKAKLLLKSLLFEAYGSVLSFAVAFMFLPNITVNDAASER